MKRLPLLLLLLLHFVIKLSGQDIIFKNPTDKVLVLDTSFQIRDGKLNLFIGPDIKKDQNTIFFTKPFIFVESTIDSFRIKGSYLQHLVIQNTKFNLPIQVDSTAFDTLFIENSTFKYPVTFRNIEVQHFSFSSNIFPTELSFVNCTFKNFSLERSVLPSKINFINCAFESIFFRGTKFKETLFLSGSSIPGIIDFDSCVFEKNLFLASLKVSATTKLSFVNTYLPDTFDLSGNSVLVNPIDLTKTNYNKFQNRKCRLLLNKFDFPKVQLNYIYFKLIFPKESSHDERETVYENLLQNFKSNAYLDSYILLDVEYKRFRNKNGTLGFLWWLPEYWWNYGYDKGYVFYWTIGFLLLLTLINFCLINWLQQEVYSINKIPAHKRRFSSSRLWYSFVYTSIVFFSLSIKIDEINFKNKIGTMYVMIIYILGLVCLAYMANFVIQR